MLRKTHAERREAGKDVLRSLRGGGIDADAAVADNAGGARTAVEHLIAAGHRRIAFLGDHARIFTATERLRGYREALAAHGIAYDSSLVRMELHDSEAAARATDQLVTGPLAPTALLTAQNLITVGAVQRLRALELRRRVAHVSFDDLLLADALEPGLTVIAQDAVELGRAAAERLFARLDGDTGATQRIEIPTRLIERGSGELRP